MLYKHIIILTEFEVPKLNVILTKELSNNGISSQSIFYSDLQSNGNLKLSRQSLYVVFIPTVETFQHFSTTTKNLDMSYYSWLIIFREKNANSECRSPTGNPFNLVFNTRMMVVCYDDNKIMKWFSLNGDDTDILELARWNPWGGIVYENISYSDYRNDLGGITLRVITVKMNNFSEN